MLKHINPIKRVACMSSANISGVVRATSRVPMHYWVDESLYTSGMRIGGPIPDGWTGSHFYVGDDEPMLADFTGARDHFVATDMRRMLVLTPAYETLKIKDILLPTAATHAAELNGSNTVHRVQNGSVLIVGDAGGTMRLVFFFFDETFHDYRGFGCMLSQSERHMHGIWQRRGSPGALPTEPSIAVGETTHRPLPPPQGLHPVVKDVLLTLQKEARHAGNELTVRLITKISGLPEARRFDLGVEESSANKRSKPLFAGSETKRSPDDRNHHTAAKRAV